MTSKLIKQKTIKWLKRLSISFVFLLLVFVVLDWLSPLPMDDFKERRFAQVVVDKHGLPLRSFPDKQGVWRYPVELEDISPLYLEALINYEDRYFYQHFGVNPLAVVRALTQRIAHGKWVSGASTLTMQVARILQPHKKSFSGKLLQMFRALQLEWHYSKDEILTFYVNYAPFGGPIEGVQTASYVYLDKSAAQLSHSEAALLAVMPQSPSRFRPDKYPQRAQKARDKLMSRLLEFDIWTEQTVREAQQEEVYAQYNTRPQIAPLLSRNLRKQFAQQQVIQSTIDSAIQIELEAMVKDYINTKPKNMSAAVLVMDNHDLSTVAYIGSADFLNEARAGHVDMIQAVRSPGSTLKPFIYALAIDQGIIHAQSLLFDVPQSYDGYRPKNFHDVFSGPVSVTEALQRSLNMPAVQVLNQINPQSFYAQLKNAGLNLYLPDNSKPNLSLALGGGGVTMRELLGLFSSLGRNGITGLPRTFIDEQSSTYPLLSKGSAWIVHQILSSIPLNNQLRSKSLMPQNKVAFKTGTSYGFRDAWVLATAEQFSIAIWLGQPDGSFLQNNSGRMSAVPLLQKALSALPYDLDHKLNQPDNVTWAETCWPLGIQLNQQKPEFCHKKRGGYLLDGTAAPTLKGELSQQFASGLQTVTVHPETTQRVTPQCFKGATVAKHYALWPVILEPYLPLSFRRQSILPKFSPDCGILSSDNTIKITGVHDQAILYPETAGQKIAVVQLNVKGSTGKSYWFVNGQLNQSRSSQLNLIDLSIGHYKIQVIDDSGAEANISFTVKP